MMLYYTQYLRVACHTYVVLCFLLNLQLHAERKGRLQVILPEEARTRVIL